MLFPAFNAICYSMIDWLMPAICVTCGHYTHGREHFCSHCLSDLPQMPLHCHRCGHYLYGPATANCGACLRTPPPFAKLYALFPYEWPIVPMITRLKFRRQLYYAEALGQLLAQHLQACYAQQPLPDYILPIPLHDQRLRERGFNQSLELARPLAKQLGLPIDTLGITRHKSTLPQSELSASQRRKNVSGAFKANRSYQGLHIALLDDVVTTGSTIRECSLVLKANGARRIDIWCCARRG